MNEILEKTLEAINDGKEEIFNISEKVRQESESIKKELESMQCKMKNIIREVDSLEMKEKSSRKRLLIVSRDFEKYSEQDIKNAYEEANNYRIKLILKREEEKNLLEKRRDLEIRLKNAKEVVKNAEKLVGKVGVAMDYLSGNLSDIMGTIDDMNRKQYLGIKIIEAQEEERQRVARDIHDGPAQSMANVVLKAELCEKLMKIDVDKARNELKFMKTIVRNSLRDIRKIIYDLRPMSLDDLGLIPTVKRYVSTFVEDTGINTQVKVLENKKKISSIIQIASFRILQESLNNIRKHSKATDVLIKIEVSNENLNIVIKDNGVGFNKDKKIEDTSPESNGFGLIGMKERAELLNGRVEVSSAIGEGTKILIIIPLERKDDFDG